MNFKRPASQSRLANVRALLQSNPDMPTHIVAKHLNMAIRTAEFYVAEARKQLAAAPVVTNRRRQDRRAPAAAAPGPNVYPVPRFLDLK